VESEGLSVMLDKLITALNKINHNLMVMFLFILGCVMALISFAFIVHYPNADHDIAKGLAAIGGGIIIAATTAFRGSSDASRSTQESDGSTKTEQASVSGDPAPPEVK
jgi:uncharacterized membrane protein